MPNQQQIQQVIQQAQRLANDLRSLANQSPDRMSRDSLTEGAHHLEMCVRECEHTSQRVQQPFGQQQFQTTTYGQQQYQPTTVTASGYGQFGQTGQAGQYGGYGQMGQTGQYGSQYGTGQYGTTQYGTGQYGQIGQSGQSGQSGQYGQYGQSGQYGQMGTQQGTTYQTQR